VIGQQSRCQFSYFVFHSLSHEEVQCSSFYLIQSPLILNSRSTALKAPKRKNRPSATRKMANARMRNDDVPRPL
jgi:hypothetical protein